MSYQMEGELGQPPVLSSNYNVVLITCMVMPVRGSHICCIDSWLVPHTAQHRKCAKSRLRYVNSVEAGSVSHDPVLVLLAAS